MKRQYIGTKVLTTAMALTLLFNNNMFVALADDNKLTSNIYCFDEEETETYIDDSEVENEVSIDDLGEKKFGNIDPSLLDPYKEVSGKCGENLTYSIKHVKDDIFTLYISGSGDMYNYVGDMRSYYQFLYPEDLPAECVHEGNTPWYDYFYNQFILEKIYDENKNSLSEEEQKIVKEKMDECTRIRKDAKVKLIIENGVNSIGINGFSGMDVIKGQVYIPESVKTIGSCAFSNCDCLEDIVFPNSIKVINYKTLFGLNNLKSIVIPEGVELIENEALEGNDKLINVDLPNSLKKIKTKGFCSCDLLESIYIPPAVESIGGCAFLDCTNLKYISGGEGLKHLAKYNYINSNTLPTDSKPEEEYFEYPDDLDFNDYNSTGNYISYFVFWDHNIDIKLVNASQFLKNSFIDYEKCRGNRMKMTYSFVDTDEGKDDSIVKNGKCGENLTYSLKKINGSDNRYSLVISGTGEMDDYCYDVPSLSDLDVIYKAAPWHYWSDKIVQLSIEQGVTSIGSNAFYKCDKIEKVNISKTVKSIKQNAFKECNCITKVSYPDTLEAWKKIVIEDGNEKITAFFKEDTEDNNNDQNNTTPDNKNQDNTTPDDNKQENVNPENNNQDNATPDNNNQDNSDSENNNQNEKTDNTDDENKDKEDKNKDKEDKNTDDENKDDSEQKDDNNKDEKNNEKSIDVSGKTYKLLLKAEDTEGKELNDIDFTDAVKVKKNKVYLSKNLKVKGYKFKGWYINNGDTKEKKSTLKQKDLSDNMQIIAVFNENTYTVKYKACKPANDKKVKVKGKISSQKNVKYTTQIKLSESGFTCQGYTLIGWSTKSKAQEPQYSLGAEVSGLSEKKKGVVKLYPVWKLNQ